MTKEELEQEAKNDRWNDGALDALRRGQARSADPDYLEGFAHGTKERQIRVIMPARPEGYYHQPVGTFD